MLSSDAFSEAPILARLLKYLCGVHFSENKSSLNEYRIGVEALGRAADFDPARNSCVRVEMHRLRARLRRYYETEGADHACRIMLMDGRYGLRFVRHQDGSDTASIEAEESRAAGEETARRLTGQHLFAEEPFTAASPVERIEKRRLISYLSIKGAAIAVAVVAVLAISVWASINLHSRQRPANNAIAPPPSPAGAATVATAAAAENEAVRILAGFANGKYIDRDGRAWGNDRYFKGGEAAALNLPYIQGTADPTMYHTARVGEFSYDIPAKPGHYELRLHFVETSFGPGTFTGRGESSRVFSVFLGDQPLLNNFDILSDAGGNFRAFTRVFKGVSAGSDGMIHLKFRRGFDQPMVNAIELVPEVGGRMNPVRIVMQENSYVDHAGRLWSSDQYAIGGVIVPHQNPAVTANDPHLYDGERFGHFTYQIPVARGRYTVTLHFTEAFYGAIHPRSVQDSRVFDVYANGEALLRNFDIFDKAGGPNKPVSETFHGIQPDAAGLIAVSFVPVKNYACVSAIEVTDESQ